MRNKFLVSFINFLILINFTGCEKLIENLVWEAPPYVITKPVCEISERTYVFTYAGLSFKFLNGSGKTVNRITVSFMLFDAKTLTNPFIGSNIFEISKLDLILPDENREILISLDGYIYTAPTEPYLIDYFYISEISYTDGSVWQDKFGIYNTGTVK